MKLAKFMAKEGEGALARIAREVGVSHTSVQRWRDGSIPRKRHLHKLKKATGDKVTEKDFYR